MSFPENLRQQLQNRWDLSQRSGEIDGDAIIKIDDRIVAEYERHISPVVIDLAGFTTNAMQHGIIHHLSKIEMLRALVSPIVDKHKGTLVKEEADNVFAFFEHPTRSLQAVADIFDTLQKHNEPLEDYAQIDISVGIGFGPTLVLPHDMWGTDFNFCCKLGEDLAKSNEVLITKDAREEIKDDTFHFEEKAFVIAGMPMRAFHWVH